MKKLRIAAAAALIILLGLLAACSDASPSDPPALVGAASSPADAQPTPEKTEEPTPEPTPAEHTVFAEGILIDGIDLAGMTREEAGTQVAAKQNLRLNAVGVTLQFGEKSWKFTDKDVTCSFNTDTVLKNAWDLSERNYRMADEGQDLPAPVQLVTTLSIDASPIEEKVRNLAFSFYVPFVNSTFAKYDATKPDGRRLVFTTAKPGKQVNADKLWAAVQKEFSGGTFGVVQIKLESVPAKINAADWQKNLKLVSRFVSVQGDHTPARVRNVTLACKAVSGHFIMPGETFSFNGTTGPRTAAKGYQVAHVINGGVVDNGLGGGTCQVSGTLFNAAARSLLTITERHHHTLKSAYLPLGQDATVDYGHYDLKLTNDTDSPMLIVMYVGTGANKWNVYAEIYGKPLAAGNSIDLVSKITETVPASTAVSFATSDTVKPGTYETIKPHVGWKVTTYRVFKRNGEAYRSVVLHKDYYKEAGTIIVYNPADPQPTLPPALAAAAAASPSSTPKPR